MTALNIICKLCPSLLGFMHQINRSLGIKEMSGALQELECFGGEVVKNGDGSREDLEGPG